MPLSSRYFPTSHGEQEEDPASLLYLPDSHFVHLLDVALLLLSKRRVPPPPGISNEIWGGPKGKRVSVGGAARHIPSLPEGENGVHVFADRISVLIVELLLVCQDALC